MNSALLPSRPAPDRATLAGRLREAMARKKVTPAALARAADTTEGTISNWLNEAVRPEHVKAVVLFRIAEAAGIDPRELLLGEPLRVSETQAEYTSHPVQREHLTLAIQLVSEVLEQADRTLPPAKQAEAAQLAYDLLEEGLPQAKVLRFVRTAIAA